MVHRLAICSIVMLFAAPCAADEATTPIAKAFAGTASPTPQRKANVAQPDRPVPVVKAVAAKPASDRQTLVIQLANTAAGDLATAIELWSRAGSVSADEQPINLVTVASQNRLLVTGSKRQLARVNNLVQELDKPVPQIRIRMALVEMVLDAEPANAEKQVTIHPDGFDKTIAGLEQVGERRMVACPEVVTLDNTPAMINVARRVPQIVGTNVSSRGTSNSIELANVGTLLQVTPRLTGSQGILLNIDMEHSYVGDKDEGTPVATSSTGVVIRTPQLPSISLKTVVSAPSGKTVQLAGMVTHSDRLWRRLVILVQAEVVQ